MIAASLAALGVDCVISIPGSQTLPIWDGLPRLPGMRLVVARSERHAAYMAEGYGQARRAPAALISTLGPGVANELPGVYSAWASQTPVLCLSPYQPHNKRARIPEVFQGLDHVAYFRSACKQIRVIEGRRLGNLPGEIEAGHRCCLEAPCGPVRLELSFPALFRRGLVRLPRPGPTQPLEPAGDLLVVSDDDPTGWLKGGKPLRPGLGHPGVALPFALGAKLGAPNTPVVALTSTDLLLEHLDTLAVAELHNLPIQIVSTKSATPRLAEPARILGARTPVGGPAALQEMIRQRRDHLTVVVED
jgi:thiamine pyrophosphate-dependent acetolactate synthase large subunit-like protein